MALQPFGLTNWQECHKNLVICSYSLIYNGSYAGIYVIGYLLFPKYFDRKSWTYGKEFSMLCIFIPVMSVTTWFYAVTHIPEMDVNIDSFIKLLRCNCILSSITIPCFGFFISKKLPHINAETPLSSLINTELPLEKPVKMEIPVTMNVIPENPETPLSSLINILLNPDKPVTTTWVNNVVSFKNTHLDVTKILYAEIKRNTLHIYHIYNEEVQHLEKPMTLIEFKDLVSGYMPMINCQKSYVVNINYIESWEGTKEKMSLNLKNYKPTIPVSESLFDNFKELMELLSIPKIK